MTVDLAISLKQTADYTVICTWAVTPENDLLLLDRVRDRMDNPTQQKVIATIFDNNNVDYIKIESVAYQLSLVQQLRKGGFPIREFKPIKDKVSRATTASVYYEGGSVYHPANAPWLQEWEEELLLFPNARNDDQVDNCSMACEEIYQPRRIGGIFFDTSTHDPVVDEAYSSERYSDDETGETVVREGLISDEEAIRIWR
jgi:predicted phage terminase large subunit-like protein